MNAALAPAWAPPARTAALWLTADERADLTTSIEAFLDAVTPFPHTKAHLSAVLLELEVTSARDRLWPHAADTVRTAAGYTPDTVAVRLSRDELDALTTVAGLPAAVTVALTARTAMP